MRPAILWLALLGAILCMFGTHVGRTWDFTVDDAAITYSYARNVANGHGFVLTPGSERVEAAGAIPVKVILETSMLDRDQKVIACALSKAAGAAFVKTSTGFGGGGATAEDIALMRQVVGDDIGVKASGGVRTIDDAEKMIEAGASRIGASSSVAIVQCVRPSAQDAKKSGGSKAY